MGYSKHLDTIRTHFLPNPEELSFHKAYSNYSNCRPLSDEALAKFGQPASLSTTANARSSESESNEREFCEPRPLGSRFSEFCKSLALPKLCHRQRRGR